MSPPTSGSDGLATTRPPSAIFVLCTYAETDNLLRETGLPYPPVNFNFPSRRMGEDIHTAILGLLGERRIRAVVDRVVEFEELPAALDAFERRETIGRVVVTV